MTKQNSNVSGNVLFVCTGNAGRSQIAQAILRHELGNDVVVESAGVAPWNHLHPMAVSIMAGRGLSLDGHYPKHVDSLASRIFDVVVTIGSPAREKLPRWLSSTALWMHWDIPDPADADGTPESESRFLQATDAILARMPSLRKVLGSMGSRRCSRAKVGISTSLWGPQRFEPNVHLPQVAKAGFDSIELCIYWGKKHFDADDSDAVRELVRVADDCGISVWSIHSMDVASLASPNPEERHRQIDILRRDLELAATLGAKVVVSHGLIWGRFPDDSNEADRLLAESLAALLPEAEAGPASIAFENNSVSIAGRSPQDVLRRIEAASPCAFGFMLDPGHSNISGDLHVIARSVGQRLISLHLNDNDGHGDLHLPPTEGTVDWPAVQDIVLDSDYRGCLLYEVLANNESPEEVLRRTMGYHQSLWPLG